MKIFTGKVVSTKMLNTATVEIERIVAHPLYKKRMRKTRLFQVHDEGSTAKVGDIVKFVGGKPISKTKRWTLISETKKTLKVIKESKAKKVTKK